MKHILIYNSFLKTNLIGDKVVNVVNVASYPIRYVIYNCVSGQSSQQETERNTDKNNNANEKSQPNYYTLFETFQQPPYHQNTVNNQTASINAIFQTTYNYDDHWNQNANNQQNYEFLINEMNEYLRNDQNRQENGWIVAEEYVDLNNDNKKNYRVVTLMRASNLYVEEVIIIDANNPSIVKRYKYRPGQSMRYQSGSSNLIPIFFYNYEGRTHDEIINSQAFALSEAIRFKKGKVSDETPFQFVRKNRFLQALQNFTKFSEWYNNWSTWSENGDDRVDVKCKINSNKKKN